MLVSRNKKSRLPERVRGIGGSRLSAARFLFSIFSSFSSGSAVPVLFAAVAVLVCVSPSRAATFQVVVEGGAMARVGETATMSIMITPGEDEQLVGGQCTVTVDPAIVELPGDRSRYAADPVFALVEAFAAKPEQGMIMFRAKAQAPLAAKGVFLRVPFKFKQAGATFVSFTSTAIYADDTRAASNPGYFRLVGYEGEVDPVLYSAVVGENVLLTTESIGDRYVIVKGQPGTGAAMQADLGFSALEKTDDAAKADVVVGFSKSFERIGLRQWVRLDLVIEKFPESEIMTGIEVKIKYDPKYMELTDRKGQAADVVEVQERLDRLSEAQLREKFKQMGLSVPDKATNEEMTALLQSALKWDYQSAFTDAFVNTVDKAAGEIHLVLLVDIRSEASELKAPMTVVTLYFKGMKEGGKIPVSMEDVLVPVLEGSQYVRNAEITIDPDQKACDETLPAALCSGSFKITGNVSFTIDRTRKPRIAQIRMGKDDPLRQEHAFVEKLKLSQSWNVFLNGSFRNGMSVDGTVSESPGQPEQHLDIELTSSKGSVRFGDFNTNFESGTMISLNNKKINGVQFDYKFGALEFASIFAESKSSTKSTTLAGNNTKGPYRLSSALVIPGTIHISDENGNEIPASEYTVDYGKLEVLFDGAVPSGKNYTVTYEEATFVFSTGNLSAFRVGYARKSKDNTKDRIKIGASYLMAAAPKSATFVVLDEIEPVTVTSDPNPPNCPHKKNAYCQEIVLKNPYIIPGSLVVIQQQKEYYPETENSAQFTSPVFVDHRGWFLGRIYVERPAIYGDITVKYSHYSADLVSDTGFVVYKIPVGGSINDTNLIPYKPPWPTNLFPGSEITLLSNEETNQLLNTSDTMLCHKRIFNEGAPSEIEIQDSSDFCPGEFQEDINRITYQLIDLGSDTYLDFDGTVSYSDKYQYLKIRYSVIPANVSTGSEFTKTALGVTGKFEIGNGLSIEGEYAVTNSDLASSFSSGEDVVTVDAFTGWPSDLADQNDIDANLTCKYYGELNQPGFETEKALVCKLRHGNITGDVTIALQHCGRQDGISQNDCEGVTLNNDNTYNFDNVNYLTTIYDVNQYVRVDRAAGEIIFIRRRNQYFQDMGYTQSGNYFPNRGDKITVKYIFDKALGQIVEGGSYNVSARYTGKNISANISQRATDPFFDKSMGGAGQAARTNDNQITGNLSVKLGDWSLAYSTNKSDSELLDSKTLKTTTITNSVSNSYTATFTGKPPLTSIGISHGVTSRFSLTGVGVSGGTPADTEDTKTSVDFSSSFKRNKFTLGGKYSVSGKDDAYHKSQNTDSTGRNLSFKYVPRGNLDVTVGYADLKTSPGNNAGRNNDYQIHYVPFNLIDTTVSVRKAVSSGAGRVGSLTETTEYRFTLKKSLYKFSNINMSFNRTSSPQSGAASRSDARTFTFTTELPFGLSWKPSFSRNVSSQPNSWSLTNTRRWDLSYSRGNKKLRSAQWSRTVSSAKSALGVKTNTGSDNFNFNVVPSQQTQLTLTYGRNPSISSHNYTARYTYKYTKEMNFNLNATYDRKGGVILTKSRRYTFNTQYQLNPTTNLTLDYTRSRTKTDTRTTAPGTSTTDTTFRATLNARFQ